MDKKPVAQRVKKALALFLCAAIFAQETLPAFAGAIAEKSVRGGAVTSYIKFLNAFQSGILSLRGGDLGPKLDRLASGDASNASNILLQLVLKPGAVESLSPQIQNILGPTAIENLRSISKSAQIPEIQDRPVLKALQRFKDKNPGQISRELASLIGDSTSPDSPVDYAYYAQDGAVAPERAPAGRSTPRLKSRLSPSKNTERQQNSTSANDAVKVLFQVRSEVQEDARTILRDHLGGDVGDGVLHRDLQRVLKRLTRAAGLPPQAAQVFVGNSKLPNAFTTIVPSEAAYLQDGASLAKAFRVSNIFLSLGLLRALETEDQLAFVLAHELMHNLKGHLKSNVIPGSAATLGHFHELEADAEGLKLVAKAGYRPEAAIDSLYALHREYDRLGKQYALLGRDKSEAAQVLSRLQDVHPHPDIRRANMLDFMNEAKESQILNPAAEKTPAWMSRREAAERPTNVDRFEARMQKTLKTDSIPAGIRSIEIFVQAEAVKKSLPLEKYAIVEEAYRTLVARVRTPEELRAIEVSVQRQATSAGFPSKRLQGDLISKQLDLVIGALQQPPSLREFLKDSGTLSIRTKEAGTLRLLGLIRTRRQLDEAFSALSDGAESLGFVPADMTEDDIQDMSRRLWGGARRILLVELKRPPVPEEIISELINKLPPSWLKTYREGFQTEILESAFGPDPQRSKKYRPSQLAAMLEGRSPNSYSTNEKIKKNLTYSGSHAMKWWNARHYSPPSAETKNGKMLYQYERYSLKGLTPPNLEDQLDITLRFTDGRLPEAFTTLLRRNGKLEDLLAAHLGEVGGDLKRSLANTMNSQTRAGLVDGYSRKVEAILVSSLRGVRELGPAQKTVAACWLEVNKLVSEKDISGVVTEANRSALADAFLKSMSGVLRQIVVQDNMSGSRPDPEELRLLRALVLQIESTLRPFSGFELIKAYSRHLEKNLSTDQQYIDAYADLLYDDFYDRTPILDFINKMVHKLPYNSWIRAIADLLLWGLSQPHRAWNFVRSSWFPRKKPVVDGVPEAFHRTLRPSDFSYFMTLAGYPDADPGVKLMCAAILDRLDMGSDRTQKDGFGRAIEMRAAAAVGRWLIEDAVSQAENPVAVRRLAQEMLRLNSLHPGLLQPDMETHLDQDEAFRHGAVFVKRNEPYRSFAKQEHPFRGVNPRWALAMMEKLDKTRSWPASTEDKLDLLDFLNSNGEFSDALDLRIIQTAQADPEGFRGWVRRDERRLRGMYTDRTNGLEQMSIQTLFADIPNVPVPAAQPLRIVRNPALRTRLFGLMSGVDLRETPPRRSLKEWWRGTLRLIKAYYKAKEYFSAEFLKRIRHEGSMEDKIFEILEETDRIAAAKTEEAGKRWDEDKFLESDTPFIPNFQGKQYFLSIWKNSLPHEKEAFLAQYKARLRGGMLASLWELYNAYVGMQDPTVGFILENYPEPTRSRDELLERLMKARKLSPGALSLIESNKSYRMPNPLRALEKQFLDQAVIQMRKFNPRERVDMMLHLADVQPLSREKERAFNRRILSGDRKKLVRNNAAIRSLAHLKSYMSLMHPKDRAMLMRAQFYGETIDEDAKPGEPRYVPLSKSPRNVYRLYLNLIVKNRNLPPFLQKLFKAYFRILTEDERAKLLSDIAAIEDIRSGLTGPEIVKVALKGMGVTGAKVAQALATHKGFLPSEYAAPLETFKDRAQNFDKMRAYDVISKRMEALAGTRVVFSEDNARSLKEIEDLSRQSLPRVGEAARLRLVRQVDYLLRAQNRRIRWMEVMGSELGSGSIKVVYKAELDDGKIWVVKIRVPGAAYQTQREFTLLRQLIEQLQQNNDLQAGEARQARQLLEEVKTLVRAEMDFTDEAAKQAAMRERVGHRPWYARLFTGRAPLIAQSHPLYVGEDIMIENFMPTLRFADLPDRRRGLLDLFRPSKQQISKLAVQEGMTAIVLDEHLEPDPHTGNRHAAGGWRGWLGRLWPRLVIMDVGQEVSLPIDRIKPLLKAGIALQAGDLPGAAKTMVSIVNVPEEKTQAEIEAAIQNAFKARPNEGLFERLMAGLIESERNGALVKPEYVALEKAFIIYTGYSEYLPKDYIYKSLDHAITVRLLRDSTIPLSRLVWLQIRRMFLSPARLRGEMETIIDGLTTHLPPETPTTSKP